MSSSRAVPPLEELLDANNIPRRTVESADFDEDRIKETVMQKGYEDTEHLHERAIFQYYRYLDEGFPDEIETVEFAISTAKDSIERSARPVEDWDEKNKKAKRLAESTASSTIEEMVDDFLVDEDEAVVNAAQREFESVKNSVDNTNWSAVHSEIENNLRRRLLEDEGAHAEIREIIRRYSNYDYNENELWRFTMQRDECHTAKTAVNTVWMKSSNF